MRLLSKNGKLIGLVFMEDALSKKISFDDLEENRIEIPVIKFEPASGRETLKRYLEFICKDAEFEDFICGEITSQGAEDDLWITESGNIYRYNHVKICFEL